MSSLSTSITELRQLLDQTESEIKSLEGGRKASSARARKSLQSIKSSSHALRKSIMEHTKALPTKSKAKKVEAEVVAEPESVPEPQKKKKARKKKEVVVEE